MTVRPGVVVIGVGTPYKRDDGVGPLVVELLRRRLGDEAGDGVELVELDGEPVRLVHSFAVRTYVVDAVRSGAPPGTIHRFELDHLSAASGAWGPAVQLGGGHLLGVPEAVELARALDRLPDRLVVLGVEGEHFDAGVGLTPVVADACRRLVDELVAELSTPNRV